MELAILALSGVQVMGMKTDDSAAYKQTLIHPSEQWKQLVFWEGDRVLVPHVLGFGGCEGPSDYQRLSCLKHHIIVDMLATSLGCSPLPAPSGWQGTIRYSAPDMNTCRALFPEEGVSAYIDLRLRKFPHSPLQWLPLWVGIYLDDHNSLTLGPHVASWLFDTMVRAADHFGWILSMKKWFAEGTPSTSKILLGVQYDFVSLTKSIPEDKVLFATKQIRGILRANGLFMSDLFSCLMRLLNLSVCIPYMRLFLNEGFILLRLAKKRRGHLPVGVDLAVRPFQPRPPVDDQRHPSQPRRPNLPRSRPPSIRPMAHGRLGPLLRRMDVERQLRDGGPPLQSDPLEQRGTPVV